MSEYEITVRNIRNLDKGQLDALSRGEKVCLTSRHREKTKVLVSTTSEILAFYGSADTLPDLQSMVSDAERDIALRAWADYCKQIETFARR